jgi:hypothetical protein
MIELGGIVVADGGGAEVQEEILQCKSILVKFMPSGEVTSEDDKGYEPQHDAEGVGDKEIVESSDPTSGLSSDATRIAETAVAQNTDVDSE